ncbi:MAG: SIMPL domain-containing protein, partial [Rickettsiales bacterium]|nr:SIMPL domain-containing protein [Rickettsiales bacterium]
AKARAEALAQAAGGKLGPVLSIDTGGGMNMPHPPMPMMAMARAGMEADASVAPSLPGAITMQEQVHVVFTLE